MLLTPGSRREVVSWAIQERDYSQRRACALVGMGRAGSEDFSRLVHYRDDYRAGARRFGVGEAPNFALLPAATAALHRILAWGVAAIAETFAVRTAAIAARAAHLGLPASDPSRRAATSLASAFQMALLPTWSPASPRRDVRVSVRGRGD
jgi:hypothetical protein